MRVIPPLPWTFDFDNAAARSAAGLVDRRAGKVFQRTVEGGGRAGAAARRDRRPPRQGLHGPPDLADYTVEADVRGSELRRQRGDVGLINQRYALVLFGNGQKLEIHPWQAADEMTVRVPFAWDADTWYRMKLRVEISRTARRSCRARCGRGRAEPAAWTIEKADKIAHRKGAPGSTATASRT